MELKQVAALFGAASCIICTIISASILIWGDILLTEPSVVTVTLEALIGVTGTVLNLYVLAGRD